MEKNIAMKVFTISSAMYKACWVLYKKGIWKNIMFLPKRNWTVCALEWKYWDITLFRPVAAYQCLVGTSASIFRKAEHKGSRFLWSVDKTGVDWDNSFWEFLHWNLSREVGTISCFSNSSRLSQETTSDENIFAYKVFSITWKRRWC